MHSWSWHSSGRKSGRQPVNKQAKGTTNQLGWKSSRGGEWAPGTESEDFSVNAMPDPRKMKEELLMLGASCPKLSEAQMLRPRGAG